jgi:hypothetical protein
MKKLACFMALALAASVAVATDAFTFVNDGDYGYSYIQINQDLDSFSFKSDWHSLGNAGRVGYVVYTSDMSDSDRAAYMEANANNPEFRKSVNGGVLDLGSLKAGDRVGFYEVRPNGGTYTQSAFKDWKDKTWLAFDKNGGNGKDEWMTIEDISAQVAGGGETGGGETGGGETGGGTGGGTGAPSGAPLPGALAVMLVGGVGAGAFKFGKKKKQA